MLKVAHFVSVLCFTLGVEYSRKDEGYPQGFLTHCPGSWKPAFIKPEALKNLFISVYKENRQLVGDFDYYHMDSLAKNPAIDFKKKTVLWNGGYLASNYWGPPTTVLMGYKRFGYNVLALDAFYFSFRYYPRAARLVPTVGMHVAEMLVKLTAHGLDPKKLELVGMSLGAQTMSHIAKNYRLMTGENISLLTTLDPTGACFRQLEPELRLDKSDADFVISVITNMDIAGIAYHISHLTFYVNGGEFQPGHFAWFPCDYICSHFRAVQLWMSAWLFPRDYIGVRCETVQQAKDGDCYDLKPMVTNTMGPYTDKSKPGIYYLRTSNRWPYALGKQGLKKPNVTKVVIPRKISLTDIVMHIFSFQSSDYFV